MPTPKKKRLVLKAKRFEPLLEEAERLLPPRAEPPAMAFRPAYRPISGYDPRWPVPRVPKSRPPKKRRGRPPSVHGATSKFIMNLYRHEKIMWARTAAVLDVPLAALMRMAMRQFLASSRLWRKMEQGGEPDEYIVTRVKNATMQRRVRRVFGIVPSPVKEEYDARAAEAALRTLVANGGVRRGDPIAPNPERYGQAQDGPPPVYATGRPRQPDGAPAPPPVAKPKRLMIVPRKERAR